MQCPFPAFKKKHTCSTLLANTAGKLLADLAPWLLKLLLRRYLRLVVHSCPACLLLGHCLLHAVKQCAVPAAGSLPSSRSQTMCSVLAVMLQVSAALYTLHVPELQIGAVLALLTALSWRAFDGTAPGAALAVLCAVSAPISEIALNGVFGLWHYPRADLPGMVSWCAFYRPLCVAYCRLALSWHVAHIPIMRTALNAETVSKAGFDAPRGPRPHQPLGRAGYPSATHSTLQLSAISLESSGPTLPRLRTECDSTASAN